MGRSYSNTPPGTAPAGSISNSEMADMAAGTQKGRATGAGTGAPQDLTALQQLVNWSAANTVIDDGSSGAADTIDFSAGPNHKSTLTAACTYTFTAPTSPGIVTLRLIQDATGNFAATFPGSVVGTPVYGRSAAADSTLPFFYDGTSYYYLGTTVPPASAITWQQQGSFPSFGLLARYEGREDFMRVDDGLCGYVASVSGAGAAVAGSTGSAPSARIGVARLDMGTTTTGRAALISDPAAVLFGGGRHRLRIDIRPNALSDATETYTLRMGYLDSETGEPTDGCYFRYTHSVLGGEYECVTRQGGTETASDSNVAATNGGFRRFEIEVNAAANSVAFYIEGVLVATNTTNIPSGAQRTGIGVAAIKSAGTTARNFDLDLIYWSFEPTTPP